MKIPFFGGNDDETNTDKDPVCGIDVLTANPPGGASRHEGVTSVFYGSHCKEEFDKDPAKFAAAASN
jgi:YHS domain-containing protein